MERGIYAASSAGLHNSKRIDVVANNLANVSTVGFKAERIVSRQQEFADTLASTLAGREQRKGDFDRTPGVITEGTTTDFSPGPISTTGNPLNVALAETNEFFVVASENGESLTRAGNFSLDSQGNLVAADGSIVQGDGGPIQLPTGTARIAGNGTVTVDGEAVGRIRVVRVTDLSKLEREGGTRFKLQDIQPEAVDAPRLVTEAVEMPNVNVVEAMVDLINAQKAFEAYTKTARTMDELNERSLRNARLSS